MKKKIVFSDFDGTFFAPGQTERNLAALCEFRKRGGLFALNTGRGLASLSGMPFKVESDFLILNNGSIVLGEKGELLTSFSMPASVVKRVFDLIGKNPRIGDIKLSSINGPACLSSCEYFTKIMPQIERTERESVHEILDLLKSELSEVAKVTISWAEISGRDHHDIDIVSKDSGKIRGIEYILDLTKLPKNFVATIGDGDNDMEMIEKYNGFAVAHADKNAIRAARKIYPTVADLLEEIEI
ncbi:Cof-type HAD-IIB family hydrolase [Candidatus Saccharibacteria bacterium]|nr:Cof-type HAD-IIB family hydrolase [Candidatus Saccharibacteria bacterium]